MAVGKSSIPTHVFGKAYLEKAWQTRKELNEEEFKGFAQYFYLTLCGHIEAVLVAIITARLNSIEHLKWNSEQFMKCQNNGSEEYYSLNPVYKSIVNIAEKLANEVGVAPLGKLIELYNKVFSEKLNMVLEKEIYQDLDCLLTLRNIFAHGRSFVMEMEFAENSIYPVGFEGNTIHNIINRLTSLKLIVAEEMTGQNYTDYLFSMYTDSVMSHFYSSVEKMENILFNRIELEPEKWRYFVKSLPKIYT